MLVTGEAEAASSRRVTNYRRILQTGAAQYLQAAAFALVTTNFGAVAAQSNADDSARCTSGRYNTTGNEHPGASFDSATWLARGQCVRNVNGYSQCRENLVAVLDSLSPLQQTEYSASANVLTLLPSLSAFLGSPTSELWALLKISPVAGLLAQCLSFGGLMWPSQCDDYIRVSTRQGCTTLRVPGLTQDPHDALEPSDRFDRVASSIYERIVRILAGPHDARKLKVPLNWLFVLGCVTFFVFIVGTMAAIAVIEQGSVYSTWCTSTWWAHLWYLIGKREREYSISKSITLSYHRSNCTCRH
jgi:hypothetical protein